MNIKTRKRITEECRQIQSSARVRRYSPEDAIASAEVIERFLRTAPNGTGVATRWPRVANSYRGIPEGTFVHGFRASDGTVYVEAMRGPGAFGNRAYTVSTPSGYRIIGPAAHHSGATDDLATTKITTRQ